MGYGHTQPLIPFLSFQILQNSYNTKKKLPQIRQLMNIIPESFTHSNHLHQPNQLNHNTIYQLD